MTLNEYVSKSKEVVESIAHYDRLINQVANLLWQNLNSGGMILICGNGGSAADAQHFAAELVGRFQIDRTLAMSCIALTTDTSILTAVGNDYGYDDIFARQVRAHGQPIDTIIGISTSGNSINVEKALKQGDLLGMTTISFTGRDGGLCRRASNINFNVQADETCHIQEAHEVLLHYLAYALELRSMGVYDGN